MKNDNVNNPRHYTSHPSGVECIEVTRHMGFNLGNAMKYIWRADEKHNDGGIEDLKKAAWYIKDELKKRQTDEDEIYTKKFYDFLENKSAEYMEACEDMLRVHKINEKAFILILNALECADIDAINAISKLVKGK